MTGSPAAADPPVARREPVVLTASGRTRDDDYAWMSTDEAELGDYLRAERRRYDEATAPTAALQIELYAEMTGRISDADESVGWQHGGHVYNTRQVAGLQYPMFCRAADGGDSEVILDLNQLAGDATYLALGARELNRDGSMLAYSVDTTGDESFALRVRDLTTGTDLPDLIPSTDYGCAWNTGSTALVYLVVDATHRPFRVMRHTLGRPVTEDVLVYEESDERFHLELTASRSGEIVVITSHSTTTTEVWLLATADLTADAWVVAPRREGVQYTVEHCPGDDGGVLYIVTNDGAVEFRLMRAALRGGSAEQWTEVLAEDAAERLVSTDAFAGRLVITLRRDGYQVLRTMDLGSGETRDLGSDLPAATITLSSNDDSHEPVRDAFDSTAVTVVIESLVSPPSWWSVDLTTGARSLLKTTETPTYNPADYVTRRVTVTAPDGTEVPVTIAHHRDVAADGTAPCLLYGYGAYEISIDPYFNLSFASLLDRGVVYAIAHIRGGGERGRNWWLQGRLHHKRNTFTDFIAAATGLAEQGVIDGSRIVTRGASAGGLLVGASLSLAPEIWRAVVAEVPFVDCLTTMLDPTLPLTAGEWDEWGDPRKPDDYDYMASYTPYENPPTGPRPNLLATGSVNDTRVMVHEPAKWVARLRATQTDDSVALLRAEVGSGSHGGPSGRYDRIRYQAEISAYILDQLDATTHL